MLIQFTVLVLHPIFEPRLVPETIMEMEQEPNTGTKPKIRYLEVAGKKRAVVPTTLR